ncbi:hypothetical protein VPH35_095587 [Triticum aestivum]
MKCHHLPTKHNCLLILIRFASASGLSVRSLLCISVKHVSCLLLLRSVYKAGLSGFELCSFLILQSHLKGRSPGPTYHGGCFRHLVEPVSVREVKDGRKRC